MIAAFEVGFFSDLKKKLKNGQQFLAHLLD
jgi:hypothetical protein